MGVESFIQFEQMKLLQNHETFATIVSMALGGGKKKGQPTPDRVHNVSSVNELVARMKENVNGKRR